MPRQSVPVIGDHLSENHLQVSRTFRGGVRRVRPPAAVCHGIELQLMDSCYDTRDEIEIAQIGDALACLREDHPAGVAYSSSAAEAADSLSLTHLLPERRDLGQRLVAAYLAHSDRIWDRAGHFRP